MSHTALHELGAHELLAGTGSGQRVGQIGEAAQTRGPTLHDLMQIDRIDKPLQGRQGGCVDCGHPQAGTQLDLGHADAGIAQPHDDVVNVFELDRRVAQVEAQAQMLPQRLGGRGRAQARQVG